MKVRTRLILLAAGAIIIPILVIALFGFLSYTYARKKTPITPRKVDIIVENFENKLAEYHSSGNDETELTLPEDIPDVFDILIVDNEKNIIFSHMSGISQEPVQDITSFLDVPQPGKNEQFILFSPLMIRGETEATIILKFPPRPRDEKRPPLYIHILERGIIGFGAFFVFSVVMAFLIMKSINQSIQKLESATRRVAEGDLDFALKAQGNDEFSSLTHSFEAMRTALKENKDQRARFLMGISHDLKTPLTSIEGYLEAIIDGYADNPEQMKKYISIIRQKSGLLEERIVQLIDLAKMETGEWILKNEEIALGKFLSTMAAGYGEDASVLKRSFRSNIALPKDFTVIGDKKMLTRAFENLIYNAIQYTREGDTITLEAHVMDGGAVISFMDTGIGIPETELSKIFEPFYRGTPSRREHGTGLGLSVAKSILNSHGWSIDVVSEPGKGSTFHIHVIQASPLNPE